ncbi:MAG: hypothetical protein U1E56_02545 [Bauldia sp.]
MTDEALEYPRIAERMRALLPRMVEIARRVPHEEQGILYSEALFLVGCIDGRGVHRIVESGRARAQSTLLFSLMLPDTEIVSIELEETSPHAPIAAERLRGRDNVRLLFGDSRELMPQLVQRGDAIFIDGPKGFRSIRLATALLGAGQTDHVFVHDLTQGTDKRDFVARNFPEARFSDRRELAAIGAEADRAGGVPVAWNGDANGDYGYGFGVGLIPRLGSRRYGWLNRKAGFRGAAVRLAARIERTFRRKG